MKKICFLTLLSFSLVNQSYAQGQLAKRNPVQLKGGPASHALYNNFSRYNTDEQLTSSADTTHILAIRVAFKPDTTSETTGDGSFDLSTPSVPTVDPAPHNRSYFDAQLQALSNYYRAVSNGNQLFTWDIYPQGENDAFQLDQDMAFYAPNDGSELVDTRLAELLRDGVLKAATTTSIDFSCYDSFILFHAGVGNDIDFDFDPTPNDITSAFLRFEDLKKEFGPDEPDYAGIEVNGIFVRNGMILPETESQEGYEIGLLGTMTIMMGFQLGLPSLFDPVTGGTGIGRWGLMDQGSGNGQGLLPAEPSAWEKIFMGWEKPIVIDRGQDFQVGSARTDFPNRIYKIPITDDEYFLIENRQTDVNGDSIAIAIDSNGNRAEFNQNGQLVSNAVIGVITLVDEYDYGLPGSGILIWHINDAIIREKLAENRINEDKTNRGVDLEEADVAQDFGYFYSFLHPGSGTENGWWADAWFDSNTVNLQANGNDKIEFGPDTKPSSRAQSQANSGVRIYDISANQAIMSFSLSRELEVANFPKFCHSAIFPPIVGEFDPTYAGEEILVFTLDNQVLAWHGDGTPLFNNSLQVVVDAPGREERAYEIPLALTLNNQPFSYPLVADLDGNGRDEFILNFHNGALKAFQTVDLDGDKAFDTLWDLNLGFKTSSALSFSNGLITFATDKMMMINAAGDVVNSQPLQADVTALSVSNGSYFFQSDNTVLKMENDVNVFATFSESVRSLASGTFGLAANTDSELRLIHQEDEFSIILDEKYANSRIAIGDVDGDNRQDAVLVNAEYVLAFNQFGAVLENFPVKLQPYTEDAEKLQLSVANSYFEPLLLDVDNDRAQEIFFIGKGGDLYGIENDGSLMDGFPLAFLHGSIQSLTAGDINNDGILEMLAVSVDGFLHAFEIPGASLEAEHAWMNYNGNRANTRSTLLQGSPLDLDGDLLPAEFAYNYPNPTEGNVTTIRYRLSAPAEVEIKIFDLAGDLVDEFSGPGNGDVDNEVVWDASSTQNGVYMARIEAKNNSQTGVAIFKISVIK
ncbi:MAG: T9SS C-terminal target domain-containing protein [Calditrichaeota bacterium]|nr:MAG: T9SS C-terminal target domain-containing protein [Calditrichota bacterium]